VITIQPAIFKDGIHVIETIERNGHEAYFVGGCVRDLLSHRRVGDIDIATSASPEDITHIFPTVIPVGIEHGTVIVRHNKQSYEVTTYRLDGTYSDQRHPDDVQFVRNINEDLKRRDFTMNALAMDTQGKIIDLFSGQADLQRGLIRAVGHAYDRFTEDPLRMIRALRFSSQLGFSIEKETFHAMKQVKQQIDTVAVERITIETEKLFAGAHVQCGIDYLKSSGIYKYLPIFKDNWHLLEHLPKLRQPLATFSEVIALFAFIQPQYEINAWIKQWKCSNATKQKAEALLQAISSYKQTGLDALLVYNLGDAYFDSFINLIDNLYIDHNLTVQALLRMKQSLPIQSIRDLAINGHEVMQLFPTVKKGQWIGTLLKRLETKVVTKQIRNTKNDLKEWIKCNPPVVN